MGWLQIVELWSLVKVAEALQEPGPASDCPDATCNPAELSLRQLRGQKLHLEGTPNSLHWSFEKPNLEMLIWNTNANCEYLEGWKHHWSTAQPVLYAKLSVSEVGMSRAFQKRTVVGAREHLDATSPNELFGFTTSLPA